MYGYLNEQKGMFNPQEIQTLATALDKAWKSIQGSGVQFDTTAHAEAARAILAKYIIETATHGERDQRWLNQICDACHAAPTGDEHRGALALLQALVLPLWPSKVIDTDTVRAVLRFALTLGIRRSGITVECAPVRRDSLWEILLSFQPYYFYHLTEQLGGALSLN